MSLLYVDIDKIHFGKKARVKANKNKIPTNVVLY